MAEIGSQEFSGAHESATNYAILSGQDLADFQDDHVSSLGDPERLDQGVHLPLSPSDEQIESTDKNTVGESIPSLGDGLHEPSTTNAEVRSPSQNASSPSGDAVDIKETSHTRHPRVKRRTSSTIRGIQDRLRRQQLKDMIGGNITDGQFQEFCASSTANAVAAVKHARRQRSRSRTKHGKMKCDQLQRPYRRWVGVSTCIASDTRYIVDKPTRKIDQESKDENITKESHETKSDTSAKIEDKTSYHNRIDASIQTPEPSDTEHQHNDCRAEDLSTLTIADVPAIRSPSAKHCKKLCKKHLRFRDSTESPPDPPHHKTTENNDQNQNPDQTTDQQPIDDLELKLELELELERPPPNEPVQTENTPQDTVHTDQLEQFSSPPPRQSHEIPITEPEPVEDVTTPEDVTAEGPMHHHDQGGLAGDSISDLRYEFSPPRHEQTTTSPAPPTPPKPGVHAKDSLRREVKTFADQSLFKVDPSLTTSKQSTLRSITKRLKKPHGKAEYINVRATQDSGGKLPGLLPFRRGQIIKQLDTGLNPVDGMFYGYYRRGKLRRKVWGVYPSTHVSYLIDTSGSEDEDDDDDEERGVNGKNKDKGGGKNKAFKSSSRGSRGSGGSGGSGSGSSGSNHNRKNKSKTVQRENVKK